MLIYALPNPGSGQASIFLGTGTYGGSRPDIGQTYGAQFTNSAFALTVSSLPLGFYQIQAYGHSTVTNTYSAVSTVNFTLQTGAILAAEGPIDGAAVTQPFALSGWAVNLASSTGTGVSSVEVWALPNPGSGAPAVPLGVATYGVPRSDVASEFGNARFTNSGFALSVTGLTAGVYQLQFRPKDASGATLAFSPGGGGHQPVTVSVDVHVPLTLDLSGSGSGTVASTPNGISCSGGFGTSCTGQFTPGSSVTLLASPDSGKTFSGWSGACSGSSASCTLSIAAAGGQLAVATFNLIPPIVTTFYHLDAVGNVRAITRLDGSVVVRHDYFPFGEEGSSLEGDPRKYLAQERDAETAWDLFGARYYRNIVGEFTSVDPAQEGASLNRPQTWNAYAYAGNNPLRFSDPSGLDYLIYDLADHGQSFWIDHDADLPKYAEGGFTFERDGTIHNAAGQVVGRYQHFDAFGRMSYDISHTAGPGVNAALVMGGITLSPLVAASVTEFAAGEVVTQSPTLIRTSNIMGKIIGWGTSNSADQVAFTRQVLATLSQQTVKRMISLGLTKEWVEELLARYTSQIDKADLNAQLLPRIEVLQKLLSLWPK